MVSIYTLSDPETGLVRYVGKTSVKPANRYAQHIYQWRRCLGQLSHLNSWIKHLAKRQLKPELTIIDEVDDSLWVTAEIAYIKLFKAIGCKLVNQTLGGEGTRGYKTSEFSKMKRLTSLKSSIAWKEKHKRQSEIMKLKHKEGTTQLGYGHLSLELRKTIGGRHSKRMIEIHKENPHILQSAIKARQKPVELIDQKGNYVMSFTSSAEAGRFLGIDNTHITRVCKGKSKQTHGFFFRYAEYDEQSK